ncbi:hypothetical protein DFJ77DRAFT_508718 [Powellomyces hirtus]|nr:hypothetical protein DFJ77DRAFT_508718 [Powellomyces hirtus]
MLMKKALSDTEGGKSVIENEYIKPSEQLRKEIQEIKDGIEDITHANPILKPPSLLLKHQAELIRRSMQSGVSSRMSVRPDGPVKLFKQTPRHSWRHSFHLEHRLSSNDRWRGDTRRKPNFESPQADGRGHATSVQESESGHPRGRLWDLRSEESTNSMKNDIYADPGSQASMDVENDAIDIAALETVECDNPLLQGYTGSVSFHRRTDMAEQIPPIRMRYLPPCTYRKRHLTDYDYSKLDAVAMQLDQPGPKTLHRGLTEFNEVDVDMRSAPSVFSDRLPKSFISLAADPSTTVDTFDNENGSTALDEKLTRFKEVEELYDEIMRTNKRTHLDPMSTEEEDNFTCPAAPIDAQMLNSWLWQGLADPSTLPTPAEKPNLEHARVVSAGPFIRLKTRDGSSSYNDPPPLHPDDFIRNRSHAMARTLSSRYNGALRYNYGGYIPGDFENKGGARVMSEPTVDDYTTFLRGRHTDFVFDLIYKEDEFAEKRRKAQEEAERIRKIEEDMKRLENERKERADQRRQMLSYERGEWNPKIMDFIAELHDASVLPSTFIAETMSPEASTDASREMSAVPSTAQTSHILEANSATPLPPSDKPVIVDELPVNTPRPISVDIRQMQQELEILWVKLKMPLDQKLDMAIKYGGHRFGPKLETAIRFWKTASELIIAREELLKEIEMFERTASDPERFFQKGPEGSSATRLKEAKDREELMRKLHFIEARITDVITLIKLELKESVTYEGAPYKEKMKSDYTDMIKRLQRERLLTRASSSRGV